MSSLEYSKASYQKPSLVPEEKKSQRFVVLVKDYLSKVTDSSGSAKPLDYSQLETIKEEVNKLHTLSLVNPYSKVITMDATSPHRRSNPFSFKSSKAQSPKTSARTHTEIAEEARELPPDSNPESFVQRQNTDIDFKDESALRRYLAPRNYGKQDIEPSKWSKLFEETMKGGRYKLEESSPLPNYQSGTHSPR